MSMPVGERRFYLGQKVREITRQEEQMEKAREQQKSKTSKGSRTTKVSGEALKNRIKNGDLPIN